MEFNVIYLGTGLMFPGGGRWQQGGKVRAELLRTSPVAAAHSLTYFPPALRSLVDILNTGRGREMLTPSGAFGWGGFTLAGLTLGFLISSSVHIIPALEYCKRA